MKVSNSQTKVTYKTYKLSNQLNEKLREFSLTYLASAGCKGCGIECFQTLSFLT